MISLLRNLADGATRLADATQRFALEWQLAGVQMRAAHAWDTYSSNTAGGQAKARGKRVTEAVGPVRGGGACALTGCIDSAHLEGIAAAALENHRILRAQESELEKRIAALKAKRPAET